MRHAPVFRRPSLLLNHVPRRRSALARAVREARGPFRERSVRSGKIYRRHPKHRLRALAEAIG